MFRRNSLPAVPMIAAALVPAFAAQAQWPADPAQNLPIADRTGHQSQAKMVPTADGGCYISWFDNADGGFDVYLQRLDAAGNELWPHNGVLVADRSYQGTVDYGLDIDTEGNALLAFLDDRNGYDQVTANRVAPDGTLLWGAAGVQLTSGIGLFVSAPDIAGTTDGEIVVAWDHDDGIRMECLNADGTPAWGAPVILTDPNYGVFWLGDLRASDNGSVIMSLRRDGPNFWDPKHVWAQKFSADGDPLWGATPLVVFDGGSLQFGNEPCFIPDGLGGAIFHWYNAVPLQCYTQHVSADGVELFGHNGAVPSTNMTRTRTNPAPCYDAAKDETYLFWPEYWIDPNTQFGHWGIYGQKFDGAGGRMWSDSGVAIMPLETIERLSVHAFTCADGAMVFWSAESGTTQHSLKAARVDATGDPIWAVSPLTVSSRYTYKTKLTAMCSTDGVAFLAWTDGTIQEGDLFAQNVNPDGTLGPASGNPADVNGDGVVDVLDLLLVLAAWGNTSGPEDINGDGIVDVLDLLELLAAWTL